MIRTENGKEIHDPKRLLSPLKKFNIFFCYALTPKSKDGRGVSVLNF